MGVFRKMQKEHVVDVVHQPEVKRFEALVEGQVAILEYTIRNGTISLNHTEVPKQLEGRGIGSSLCKAAIQFAKDNQLDINPVCWFVDKYMKRHNIPCKI